MRASPLPRCRRSRFFFFQAEDGIRDHCVTGVQTCALPISVLRVPASEYQNALIQVEAIGNVTNSIATSNDVTIKYTDMNATLQSLLTERDAFVRLLNQSTRLNTTIAIEGYLQGVNAQINSVQSEILQASRLIDYATITTTFTRGAVKT